MWWMRALLWLDCQTLPGRSLVGRREDHQTVPRGRWLSCPRTPRLRCILEKQARQTRTGHLTYPARELLLCLETNHAHGEMKTDVPQGEINAWLWFRIHRKVWVEMWNGEVRRGGNFFFFFHQHCYNMHACVSRKKRCVIFLRMKMSWLETQCVCRFRKRFRTLVDLQNLAVHRHISHARHALIVHQPNHTCHLYL